MSQSCVNRCWGRLTPIRHARGLQQRQHFCPRHGYTTTASFRQQRSIHEGFDEETDVLIVGSGGAGLCAALRCHAHSLRSIIAEKTDKIGGTTALSGGGLWIPNNPYHRARGVKDSIDQARTYMDHCIGDVGPASSSARRTAFLENAPQMLEFLRGLGFQGRASGNYPNYYPDLPGGQMPRSVESAVFDARKLGPWRDRINRHAMAVPPIHTDEASRVFKASISLSNMLFAARKVVGRALVGRLLGQSRVTMGHALIAQLLWLNKERQTDIWLRSPLEELIVEDGAVVGGIINRDGSPIRVRTTRGVILVAGGFAQNAAMRTRYHEAPISTAWTLTSTSDTGDAIRIGLKLSAQVALMDDAWWGATLVEPATGARFFCIYERALPHSIIVDSGGSRFMNEAESYTDLGQHMYKRNRTVPAIPAWMILDADHRRKYPLGNMPMRYTPDSALRSGFLVKDDTLAGLATKIGVDSAKLEGTIQRFNEMARRGVDEDFGRGGNDYDRFFADSTVKPNGCLGPIEKGPFYATKIWPGDLGTKGGLLTDENAQVINESGNTIPGLFAAGNTTASVMGRTYPGPGSTLGPALTFAYIAVNHMAKMQP